MKNFFIKYSSLLLLLCTIPIQTKNSISKISKNFSTKATSWFKRTKEVTVHHEFNHVTHLTVECLQGPITVQSWKQSCVFVELKKTGNAAFEKNVQMTAKKDGQSLKISTDLLDKTVSGSLSLHIFVPQDLPINIKTNQSAINICNTCGPLQLESNKGLITVTDGNNTVIAKSISGDILIQRKKMKPAHALNISSTYGNITLAVPQDINAEIEAHSNHGKIQSDLFVTLKPQTITLTEAEFKNMHHHVHAIIGQPLQNIDPATILLTTESGNIKICNYDSITKNKTI